MNLQILRNKINKIDSRLISLLTEREKISKEIGTFKLKNNLPINNPQREKEIILDLSKKYNLNPIFIKKVFTAIFMQSKKIQEESFKDAVYGIVKKIKKGSVLTYKQVAVAIGKPNASRAVGNILNKNYDPKIPCHRVIRSDGKIGGYNRGSENKVKILKEEGAYINRFK